MTSRLPAKRVRPATREDVAFVIDCIRGLADYEKLGDQLMSEPEALAEHLFGSRPFAEVLIGEFDGKAAGYALFFHSYSTFLTRPGIYLEDLFVLPTSRGCGLGKSLLAAVAALAVERNCGRLEWSVLDWNEAALAFYRAVGALPVDGWTVHRLTGAALGSLATMHRV